MRYVLPLSEKDSKELASLFKYHNSHSVRRRAHLIILSADGFSIGEIARIYQVHRDTVVTTFERWEKEGITGLYDAPKSGRPPKLSKDEADKAIKFLKEDPRSIKKALIVTKENTGKEISEWTLKRIAKKDKLRWKRMRKSPKGKRNKVEFKQAKEEIKALHAQEMAGALDLYYFDETGFNLTPDVPYAWQEIGKTIRIPSSSSQRINVLGFCNKEQDFHATTVVGSVNSVTVITFFDHFCQTIKKKTIVIIDNASIHTSRKFKEKLPEWEKKGLIVKFLPTYSPELNLIEIVWRFIKYSWLPLTAYLSFKHLKDNLQKVLDGIGSKYQITFA
jgi:transposase